MKPSQRQLFPRKRKASNIMADENKEQQGDVQVKESAWDKFRAFVKKHKGKIIGGFTAIVCYLAGDGTLSTFVQSFWNAVFGG